MKRLIIYLLLFSIIFGTAISNVVYGQDYDRYMEEAILKVKALFSISDDYDRFNSNISSYDERILFYFNWTDSTNNLPNISVTTDLEGNILSYYKYDSIYIEPSSKLPNYTKEEAMKIALKFIERIDPILSKEIKLDERFNTVSIYDLDYGFRFIRIINNLEFQDNSVNISVNKYSGKVTNYYVNWDKDLQFPIPKNIISLEEAKKNYIDQIGLKLVYKSTFGYPRPLGTGEEDSKYYLAYTPVEGNSKGIDAFTGKPISLTYYGPYYPINREMEKMEADAAAPIITPEERAEIEKLAGVLTIEEAEKEARKLFNLNDNFKLEGKSLHSDWNNPGEYRWSLTFNKELDKKNQYVYVTLDAKTNELISFNKYNDLDANAKVKINKTQSLQLARDFIKKINPEALNHIEYFDDESIKDDSQIYYFRFIRKVNDIYVETDGIYIGVDAVNKEIVSYSKNWYKGSFPEIKGTISLEKAYDILFNEIGFDLNYTVIYDYEKPAVENREVKLVYRINPNKPAVIDAHTGDLLDHMGKPYKDSQLQNYTDIEDSYAKDMINTLAEYGIGFSSDKFRPEEIIKQKDFLYLLWKSMHPYRTETELDTDTVYNELIRLRIVREGEEDREKNVTKEEAIRFVIRVLKYDKVADIQNIFADIFKDGNEIAEGLKGYMSIAYGLKLISTEDGLINPKYQLQRQDAASIIYKYMFME